MKGIWWLVLCVVFSSFCWMDCFCFFFGLRILGLNFRFLKENEEVIVCFFSCGVNSIYGVVSVLF